MIKLFDKVRDQRKEKLSGKSENLCAWFSSGDVSLAVTLIAGNVRGIEKIVISISFVIYARISVIDYRRRDRYQRCQIFIPLKSLFEHLTIKLILWRWNFNLFIFFFFFFFFLQKRTVKKNRTWTREIQYDNMFAYTHQKG